MTTNLQLSATEPKNQEQKLSKQLEQEQNPRNEDHMGGYQGVGGEGVWGRNVQEIRSIIGRHKIDMGMLGIVQEIEEPKNLYVQPMDMR